MVENREQDEVAAAFAACFEAFARAYPSKVIEEAEGCDAGSWRCPECPFSRGQNGDGDFVSLSLRSP